MKTIRVSGLTRLEGMDLKKRYPDAKIDFETGATGQDLQHGELVTFALIALTVSGLNVLAAWLLKNRKNNTIEHTYEVVYPDGRRTTEKFSMKISESTTEVEIAKALAGNMRIDFSKLPAS